MPATRATASTSPFVMAPAAIFDAVSGSIITRQRATVRRCDGSFAVTSTMRARPSGSRCVNSDGVTAAQSRGPPARTPRPRGRTRRARQSRHVEPRVRAITSRPEADVVLVEEAQHHRIKVLGPDLRDPRLHVAAVIVTLHVLGQTVFHFNVSIAQILAAVFTAAALELAITLWRARAIVWPAS